jgi:hypothetical protein
MFFSEYIDGHSMLITAGTANIEDGSFPWSRKETLSSLLSMSFVPNAEEPEREQGGFWESVL